MDLEQIRNRYLKFFERQGHVIIPSASLIPENDPTTLFTGAGMQPILPYLLGAVHPEGKRLVNSQKCFRAEDMDELGDNRHTTFFEMLGNWSLGDYFKNEQLEWFFTFLTDDLGLSPERLFVTVFAGESKLNLPKDTDSVTIWKELFKKKGIEAKDIEIGTVENGSEVGMQGGRIFYYGGKKNWWSRVRAPENMPVGEPGGPDSEVFFEFKDVAHDPKYGKECHPNCDCGRFLEIGNSVFMQYIKKPDGQFGQLPQRNVDFGGGLERIATVLANTPDIFKVDVLAKSISILEKRSGTSYEKSSDDLKRPFRIIADHIRAAVFMGADGVVPGNKDRGYILRRLVRRALFNAKRIGLTDTEWLPALVDLYADTYRDFYAEIDEHQEEIRSMLIDEAEKFYKTLEAGLKQFERLARKENTLTAADIFDLYQSYGFPEELSIELAQERNVPVDRKELAVHKEKHRELSRVASEVKFKGGLVDTSEMSVKYHTATHLLNQALRQVLGMHIYQKGSNITPERLRFDFPHDKKMSPEEIATVEEIVNQKIKEGLPVGNTSMNLKDAYVAGVVGVFGERYPEVVTVYRIGNPEVGFFSQEICGGPHVKNTSELGQKFKIIKEEAISQGVRRIKAVLV